VSCLFLLSCCVPNGVISSHRGGGGSSEEEEEEEEFSEGVAALQAQRPANNPLIPQNVTTLNVNTLDSLISDIAVNTGSLLALFSHPGGMVSQDAYDTIQESANILFEMRDKLFQFPSKKCVS
jgi:hypothetical protein